MKHCIKKILVKFKWLFFQEFSYNSDDLSCVSVFFCVQDSSPPESQSPFKFLELNPTCLSTGQDYSKEKSYFALWLPHWETKKDKQYSTNTHWKLEAVPLRRKRGGYSDTTADPGFKKL